jgi:hypothetical protein
VLVVVMVGHPAGSGATAPALGDVVDSPSASTSTSHELKRGLGGAGAMKAAPALRRSSPARVSATASDTSSEDEVGFETGGGHCTQLFDGLDASSARPWYTSGEGT